jgi:hypothetical protein
VSSYSISFRKIVRGPLLVLPHITSHPKTSTHPCLSALSHPDQPRRTDRRKSGPQPAVRTAETARRSPFYTPLLTSPTSASRSSPPLLGGTQRSSRGWVSCRGGRTQRQRGIGAGGLNERNESKRPWNQHTSRRVYEQGKGEGGGSKELNKQIDASEASLSSLSSTARTSSADFPPTWGRRRLYSRR